jgi:hypothetical protein
MSASIESLKIQTVRQIPKKWNALVAAVQAIRPRAGAGIVCLETPYGTVLSSKSQGMGVRAAFRVTPTGEGGFIVGFGVINNQEPTIEKKPVSGDADGVMPVITHDFTKKDGRSFICLELTLDKNHQIKKANEDGITVVVTDAPKNIIKADGDSTVQHVICVVDSKDGAVKYTQVTYFNLRFQAFVKEDKTIQYLVYAA